MIQLMFLFKFKYSIQKNRYLLLSFLCYMLITFYSCTNKTKHQDFKFIVAGHAYGAPGVQNNPFHPPFMNYLEKETDSTISLAVLTGDIVQESSDTSFDKVQNYIQGFSFPFHIAPGNHDLKDINSYTNHFGKTDYHFKFNNNLFYIVDLLKSGWNFTDQHIGEIQQLIQQNDYDNVFIFTHHISWYDNNKTPQIIPNSFYARNEKLNFYSSILPKLAVLKIPIYLFGGDVGATPNGSPVCIHQYQNVHMLASGMGGEKWDNILEVSVKDSKVQIEINYLNKHPNISIDTLYNKIHL